MEYIRLTKVQQNDMGHDIIACRFKDTERCPIHKCDGCRDCNVFNKILEQLYEFENIWEEFKNCEVRENTTS